MPFLQFIWVEFVVQSIQEHSLWHSFNLRLCMKWIFSSSYFQLWQGFYKSLVQRLKYTTTYFFVILYTKLSLCRVDVRELKGVKCKFLGRSSATDMDTRTHPSHTCVRSPSDFLCPNFTHPLRAYTLPSLFLWAWAAGHSVNVYSGLMLQGSKNRR